MTAAYAKKRKRPTRRVLRAGRVVAVALRNATPKPRPSSP